MSSQLELLLLAVLFRPGVALQCDCTSIGNTMIDVAVSTLNGGAACFNGKCSIASGPEGEASCMTANQFFSSPIKFCTRWTPVK